MHLPTYDQVEQLHRKYAPTQAAYDLVFTHSHIVRDVALQRAEASVITVDKELVAIGCLLHDIGVYRLMDAEGNLPLNTTYIRHGIEGEALLKEEGYPEYLYRFASHHTGSGLTKQQIIDENLPLPHLDYTADTIEEKLVMYADKFHSKSLPPHFNTHEYYANFTKQFGDDASIRFTELTDLFGTPDLTLLIEKYGHLVRDLTYKR